jgi:hypothetical protein
MRIRTYTELCGFEGLEARFDYLALNGEVGKATFGYDRYINQQFYTSKQWRDLRHYVIWRDNGCDLGVPGYEIHDRVYIHHMNPMAVADLVHGNDEVLDPEFLITTTHRTHNAIHYGDRELLPREFVPRRPNDTKLW